MNEKEPSLVRYLRDPTLLLKDALELAHEALDAALRLAPVAGPILVALVALGVLLVSDGEVVVGLHEPRKDAQAGEVDDLRPSRNRQVRPDGLDLLPLHEDHLIARGGSRLRVYETAGANRRRLGEETRR